MRISVVSPAPSASANTAGVLLAVDAQALAVLQHALRAHLVGDARRHGVARKLEPAPQRRRAVEFARVVFRRPIGAVARFDRERAVIDQASPA